MNVQDLIGDDDGEFRAWVEAYRDHDNDGGDNWRDTLRVSKDGRPLPTAYNVMTILRFHPDWLGVVAYDRFAEAVFKLKPPPWDEAYCPNGTGMLEGEWLDSDTTRLIAWLFKHEGLVVSADLCDRSVIAVGESRGFHPVQRYLESLEWDGVGRLDTFLPHYFATKDNAYTRGIGRRWLLSAVARIMEPGCQVDCVMVLESPQGWGKSTGMAALAGAGWYGDTAINIGDKDSYQNLRHVWIYGLDELDSLRRSEITKTKTFISSRVDRYRPSFARRARDFPRQCVFVGSTNESKYLVDPTGNRRFWPARMTRAVDVSLIAADRDQLWAEVFQRYQDGEPWHADTAEFRELCAEQQAERVESDPWETVVAEWLASPRHYDSLKPFHIAEGVEGVHILIHAIGKRVDAITKFDQMRIAQVLNSLGYQRGARRSVDGKRTRLFEPVPGPPGPPSK